MVHCERKLLFSIHIFVVMMQVITFLVEGRPQVPCYFIFGDSLVDSGNNNHLVTKVKANYPPYGVDFPKGVTGRFTNGRTVADAIGELLGFREFIPSHATATDQEISRGVNYGSGGSGIREETGSHLGDRISLQKQLLNHKTTVSRIYHLQRNRTYTKDLLSKCMYVVNMGSNDYINNYLQPAIYTTSQMYNSNQYANILAQQYSKQLKRLYDLGGRKIVVFGLGPIGCTPAEISRLGTNGEPCVKSINNAVNQFNYKLKHLVDELNQKNPHAKFTFINITSISSVPRGIGLSQVPCCKVRGDGLCAQNAVICRVRPLSIFYDGFHPTEAANTVIATVSYTSISPMDASPYAISHLVQL